MTAYKFTNFGTPGAFAVARYQVGGDWAAAALLYRVKYYFDPKRKRLKRHGKEWVAMPRKSWALEAGLTESEMRNRALPRLRKRAFMDIRQMKLQRDGPKLLWINLDLAKLAEHTDDNESIVWALNKLDKDAKEIAVKSKPKLKVSKTPIKDILAKKKTIPTTSQEKDDLSSSSPGDDLI